MPPAPGPAEAVLRLSGAAGDLARLYPWLDAAAAGLALPAPTVFAMHVALEEAVVNAARHGFAPGEAGEIQVSLCTENGEAVLLVEDTGRPFDTVAAPPAAAGRVHESRPGGLGLALIRHYCRALHYERADGRNRLTMRFQVEGS